MSDEPILSVPIGHRQAVELYKSETDPTGLAPYYVLGMAWDQTGGVSADAELYVGELKGCILAMADTIRAEDAADV